MIKPKSVITKME